MRFLKQLRNDSSGVSSAEYALILAITGTLVGAAALSLGSNISHAIGQGSNLFAAIHAASDNPAGAAVAAAASPPEAGTAAETASSGKGNHGNSANAPGHTGNTPGQSGQTPANGAAAPGQAGNTPGQSGNTPSGKPPK